MKTMLRMRGVLIREGQHEATKKFSGVWNNISESMNGMGKVTFILGRDFNETLDMADKKDHLLIVFLEGRGILKDLLSFYCVFPICLDAGQSKRMKDHSLIA